LNLILEDWNFTEILEEYTSYARYPQKDFASAALKSIGKIATKSPKYGHKCIKYLVNNIVGQNAFLSSNSMIALSEYLAKVAYISHMALHCSR